MTDHYIKEHLQAPNSPDSLLARALEDHMRAALAALHVNEHRRCVIECLINRLVGDGIYPPVGDDLGVDELQCQLREVVVRRSDINRRWEICRMLLDRATVSHDELAAFATGNYPTKNKRTVPIKPMLPAAQPIFVDTAAVPVQTSSMKDIVSLLRYKTDRLEELELARF